MPLRIFCASPYQCGRYLVIAGTDPESKDTLASSEIAPLAGSSGFIVPVTRKTTVPEGYTGISTPAQLDAIRSAASGGKYILMNNIDLSGYANWNPIGTTSSPFSGTLDGNGYVIRNMHVDTSYGAGLFGYVNGTTTILNLGIEQSDVTSSDAYAGGLVGSQYSNPSSTITNGYYIDTISAAVGNGSENATLTNVPALSAAQMQQQSSFVGFDFGSIWSMPAGGGSPILQSIPVYSNPVDASGDFVDNVPTSNPLDTPVEAFVERLYTVVLGRDPDPAGLADWVSRLDGGASKEVIFHGFGMSPEFKGICDAYGIAQGTIANPGL